jgi:copper(I)-binding protein
MTKRNLAATIFICGLMSTAPVFARAEQSQSPNPSGIAVENAWSRAAPGGRTAAVYLTITDNGASDRLVSVSTPIAETAEIHESVAENGIMKMRPTGPLPVMPGKPLTLAPGHYHVMLMGLKRPTSEGDSFPLTLTFEHAPAVTVQVRIESARTPADHGMGRSIPGEPSPHSGM